MILTDNLDRIRREVAECGRDVTLIAATKTQTKDTVDEFMALAPEFELGENRVQEFTAKYDERYKWHVIGQLQTNKVKYVVGKAELIHSLDREDLAKEIEKQAGKRGIVQDCLIEVNMGAEITKGGVPPEEVIAFFKSCSVYPHIRIRGLMSVLPNLGEGAELDALYDKLRALYDSVASAAEGTPGAKISYLSAGMSNDYRTALAHGANMIRLGRVLFGERAYPAPVSENV